MTTFILLLVFNASDRATSWQVEYSTLEACEIAGKEMKNLATGYWNGRIDYHCLEKK